MLESVTEPYYFLLIFINLYLLNSVKVHVNKL